MSKPTTLATTTRLTPTASAVRSALAAVLAVSGAAAVAQTPSPATETLQEVKIVASPDSYVTKTTSTANKTDTLLRDTPQAITVITKDLMRDQNMQGLADVIRYVPGIVIAQGEGNRDTAVFRGNSSTSDFYIDGIRDDVQYFRDFYNIETVEALKGSNAMIFGRGGSGGVINRVSKVPQWSTIGEGSITLGSWNKRRISADMGQALNDSVAFRINAMAEDSESYRDYVGVERKGVNPAFAFRLGANTSAVLSLEHFQDERTADRGIPSYNGRPYQTDASTFFGNPELSYAKARANSMSLVLEHDFGNGLSLRNRTRVADYDKFYQNVFANGAANVGAGTVPLGAYNTATQRSNNFNQTDLFYSLNTGSVRHKLVAGMELGRQETDNLRQSGSSATASLAMPTSFAPVTFASTPTDANNHGVARIASFYLQDQIEFTPQWQAVVGLRYDHFKVAYLSNAPGALAKLEVTDEPLSPRVGLIYKPLENVSIYGSYSVAFVPRAGEQLASLTGRIAAFDPEEFKNMELGAKWDISPDLAATAAIYQLDRSNVLITDPNNSSLSILTDGQTSKGVELSLSGKLTRSWSVMGGYAWQEAKTKFINNPALNFKSVAMVPKQTFSLWNRYDLNDHWGAGLGLVYRDSIFASGDNAVTLPSYTRVDGAVFYKVNSNYQLQMNFENLLDKEYYASAHNNNNITPGSPRAVRFTFHAKF